MSYLITLPGMPVGDTRPPLLTSLRPDQQQSCHWLYTTPWGLVNPAGFQVVAKHSSSFSVRLVVPALWSPDTTFGELFLFSAKSSEQLLIPGSSTLDEEFRIHRARERKMSERADRHGMIVGSIVNHFLF